MLRFLPHKFGKKHILQQRSALMHRFSITIESFRQIKDFVAMATVQPFDVIVENEKQQINGKSFIGMFSLLVRFQQAAAQFLA